jgi:glutamate/tyrosine decarboxylase-like PLP-dependent enzyme
LAFTGNIGRKILLPPSAKHIGTTVSHAPVKENLTLDPENWDQIRKVGHQMLDDMLSHFETLRDQPVWQQIPDAAKNSLDEEIPMDGTPIEAVYAQFQKDVFPYPTGNVHPRFWGWVMTNGSATSMLADMLASGMNPHLAGYEQSASLIEKLVVSWLAKLIGFPDNSSGLLVSGGTMANLNGLTVARNAKAGYNIREEGLQGGDRPELTVYGSSETHNWIYKACELMGLGRRAFKPIAIKADFSIDVDACRAAIVADIAAGKKPFCIMGTVGTVNTGAVDDIVALRQIADDFDLWLHVDGAFGSLVSLAPNYKHLTRGQELADSIGFDLHKWGFMSYEIACTLVRHPESQKDTFEQSASYIASSERSLTVDVTFFADRGLQLSRGFRALKAWMCFKEQGITKIGQIIEQNIEQAQYLAQLITDSDMLELLAPVTLNIVCLRYNDDSQSGDNLNALNREILEQIQESGLAVPSQTILDGNFAIRVCITNHRTRFEDLDMLVDGILTTVQNILET